MSAGVTDQLAILGRLQLKRVVVTAAAIAAADGLIVLDKSVNQGAWLEVEEGATVRGIQMLNQHGDDVTATDLDLTTQLVIVAGAGSPYNFTIEHEAAGAPAIAAAHRLWCPSSGAPGTFGTATIGQNQVTLCWDPGLSRWRVPWSVA
jgi:hypothetical protein